MFVVSKSWARVGALRLVKPLIFGFVVTFSNPPFFRVVWTLDKKMDLGLLLLRGHKKYIAQGLTVFGPH